MNHLIILKRLAIAEGISYLSFAVTMPIKYFLNWPAPNYVVGMLHGVLFIAYCIWVLILFLKQKKPVEFLIIGWLMSLVPFGTFWFERKYLRSDSQGNPFETID